jgi:hypothetical protein
MLDKVMRAITYLVVYLVLVVGAFLVSVALYQILP